METKKELNNVLHEVKSVDSEINKVLVPLLQDTIRDANIHNKRIFILAFFELIIILIIALFSVFLVYKQNAKYEEFLSQFDFGEESVYQEVNSADGSDSIINDGIKINQ